MHAGEKVVDAEVGKAVDYETAKGKDIFYKQCLIRFPAERFHQAGESMAQVQEVQVNEPCDKGPCFLGVPRPVVAPGLFGPAAFCPGPLAGILAWPAESLVHSHW